MSMIAQQQSICPVGESRLRTTEDWIYSALVEVKKTLNHIILIGQQADYKASTS